MGVREMISDYPDKYLRKHLKTATDDDKCYYHKVCPYAGPQCTSKTQKDCNVIEGHHEYNGVRNE